MGSKGSRFAARRQITFTRPFTSFREPVSPVRKNVSEDSVQGTSYLAPCVAHPTRSAVKRYLNRSSTLLNARVNKDRVPKATDLAESVKLLARLCFSFSEYFHLPCISLITISRRFVLLCIHFSMYICPLSDYSQLWYTCVSKNVSVSLSEPY